MSGKITVTGGSGFVGSCIIDALLKENFRVNALLRKTSSRKYLEQNNPLLNIKTVDFSDTSAISNAIRDSDVVIHVAGTIKGSKFSAFKHGNIYLTKNMVDAAARAKNIRQFVFMSSQSAAGPSNTRPLNEEDAPHPVSFYGLSKKLAEEYVKKSGLPYTIFRPSAIFGARDREMLAIFKMIKHYNLSFEINKGPWFNIIYIKDLVNIVMKSIFNNSAMNETFFLNNGQSYTPYTFARLISQLLGKKHLFKLKVPANGLLMLAILNEYYCKLTGVETILTREKYRELSKNQWLASNEKLKEKLSYKVFYPMTEALSETIEWYNSKSLL